MNGILYRISQKIKNAGEQLHSRILITLGLSLKQLALKTINTRRKK